MNKPRTMPPEVGAELTGILDDSVSEALGLMDSLARECEALQQQDTEALSAALSAKSPDRDRGDLGRHSECLHGLCVAECLGAAYRRSSSHS